MHEPFSVRIGRKISLNMKYGFNRDGNKKGFLERKLQTALKKNKNLTESQLKIEQQNEERMRDLVKIKM